MTPDSQILDAILVGDALASEQLLPLVYDELRRLAAEQLAREKPGHTLQPTALVHEAYLRLVGQDQLWNGRGHFFAAAAQAMRRILVESARRKNRVRLGDSGPALPDISARRQSDPSRLSRDLRGELDWIVMKALDKDRSRRYETACGLAGDIGRYLADEPVSAGPPSSWYRLVKFLHRNRGPVLAASLVFLALVAGIVGTTLGLVEAIRARNDETIHRQTAQKERDDARFQAKRAENARHAIQMEQAINAWQRNDVAIARRILGEALPEFQRTPEQRLLRAVCDRRCAELPGQTDLVTAIASGIDTWAVATADRKVRVWEGNPARERFTLEGGPSIALSLNGLRLAAGGREGKTRVWELPRLKGEPKLLTEFEESLSVALSSDGGHLARVTTEGLVRVRNLDTGRETDWKHQGVDGLVAISAIGKHLATWSQEGLTLRNPATGEMIRQLKGLTSLTSLAFSTDGSKLVTANYDGSVRLWSVADGQKLREWKIPAWQIKPRDPREPGAVMNVSISQDGNFVAVAGWGSGVKIWDALSGEERHVLTGHPLTGPKTGWVCQHVALGKDGQHLLSATDEQDVRLWDLTSNLEARTMPEAKTWVAAVAMSADGRLVAAGTGSGGMIHPVRLLNADTGELLHELDANHSVRAVALSRDGRTLAFGDDTGKVQIADAITGKVRFSNKDHVEDCRGIAISPDGRRVASGGYDHTIRLRDIASGEMVTTIRDHAGRVNHVAFSPDGRLMASGCDKADVCIRDAETGVRRLTLQGHQNWIKALAWTADSKHLLTVDDSAKLRIWDTATGTLLRTLPVPADGVNALCVTPDGSRIVSVGYDKLTLLDWTTGQIKLTLPAHRDQIRGLAISDDGRRIVTGSHDRTVKVWDVPE